MTLTQKETDYLTEFRSQEQLCVAKYDKYAQEACSGVLKNLFNTLADGERRHLAAVEQMLAGQTPDLQPAKSAAQADQNTPVDYADGRSKQIDKLLCQDMLSMEKHVAGGYNTGIFECTDPCIRDALATIQKEEQNHGRQLYTYMAANGMYN